MSIFGGGAPWDATFCQNSLTIYYDYIDVEGHHHHYGRFYSSLNIKNYCEDHWGAYSLCDCQMVLNPSISKTSKIRVFNPATLVALSRLYVWGLAYKSRVKSVRKRSASRTEAFQFTNVCVPCRTLFLEKLVQKYSFYGEFAFCFYLATYFSVVGPE